jgi:hypothetical protein
VEDICLLEFEAPAVAEAVGGIRSHPTERDFVGDAGMVPSPRSVGRRRTRQSLTRLGRTW